MHGKACRELLSFKFFYDKKTKTLTLKDADLPGLPIDNEAANKYLKERRLDWGIPGIHVDTDSGNVRIGSTHLPFCPPPTEGMIVDDPGGIILGTNPPKQRLTILTFCKTCDKKTESKEWTNVCVECNQIKKVNHD